ncbi:hypothetical protein L195_g022591 [Trifolium pratense]|uniref:Uncharacterized protein n=1 Tax=Trifolium pratense TaxID=57577 RepID=A0A2K3N8G2_TRIPR|nr:hypothetical protein L195_g022591 [Trifolium pratense]
MDQKVVKNIAGTSLDEDVTVFAYGTGLLRVSFEGSGIGHGLEALSYFCHCFDSRKGGGATKG